MRVYADGRVTLSVPLSWNRSDCELYLHSKQDHIHELLSSIAYSPEREDEIERYTHLKNHDIVRLWGEDYTLRHEVKPNIKPNACLEDGTIVLQLPRDHSDATRQLAFEQLLRREISDKLSVLKPMAEKAVGVRTNDWQIRRMRSRWGSCRWETKRISINLELALHDPEMLKMVAMHETAHIIAHNHGEEFKSLMDRIYPNWVERQHELNQQGMRFQRWTPANERKFPDRSKNRV